MTPTPSSNDKGLDQHVQEVNDCPRCGDDHGKIVFRRLQRPAHMGGHPFEFWASCPDTREPLLLSVPEVVPP